MIQYLKRPAALAQIHGDRAHPWLWGTAKFYQLGGGVLVVVSVSGLPGNDTGFHGLHIHAGGSCGGDGFAETGSHYAPVDASHPSHAGDLPPLMNYGGRAYLAVVSDRFSIPEILGRTVVIHSDADDFHTQPAGNAGSKIACGVIERN